jgi:phage-related tail fiber protein
MGLMESRWLKKDANSFVTTNKTELEIKLNATGALEKTVDGINIKALGIVDAMLAGSIPTAKLAEGADFIKRDGSVAMTGALTLSGAPTTALQAATKAYVDAAIQGLDIKGSSRVATTGANITLSGLQTIDGVSLVAGNRVLVKDQANASENGIYVVSSGAWTRATDADTNAKVASGMYTFVSEGTVNHGYGWVLITPDPITLGTTALTFTQFNGVGSFVAGNGLTQTGNSIDVVAGSGIAVAPDSVSLGPLTTDWNIGGTSTITNVKDPVNDTDVVNKQWVIANSTKNITDKFTYDGTNASFTLSAKPSNLDKVVVIVSGAPGLSSPSDYSVSISGGVGILTLDSNVTSAMITGDVITVMYACVVSVPNT